MTTSKPLARYSAMGRARERLATAELHHHRGHDLSAKRWLAQTAEYVSLSRPSPRPGEERRVTPREAHAQPVVIPVGSPEGPGDAPRTFDRVT